MFSESVPSEPSPGQHFQNPYLQNLSQGNIFKTNATRTLAGATFPNFKLWTHTSGRIPPDRLVAHGARLTARGSRLTAHGPVRYPTQS